MRGLSGEDAGLRCSFLDAQPDGRFLPPALWRNRLRLTKDTLLRNAAPRSDRTASCNETRDELAAVSAGPCGAGPRPRGEGRLCACAGFSDRLRRRRGRVRSAARHPGAAARGSPSGRLRRDARRPRRAHRRPRLLPVRRQADHGQGFHGRGLRAEADGGVGRSGEDGEVAAAADGDRDAARLSGDHHRAAGGGGHLRPPPRIGRRRQSRRPPDQHRRFGRAGGPRQRARPAQERRGDAGAAKDAGRRRQHAAVDCRPGVGGARLGRRDRRADAGGDRAEGDPRAVLRAARPAQRRSRAIRLGRHGACDAAAARSDLRRFSRARGGAGDARRRPGRHHDGRRHSRPRPSRERSRRSTPGSAWNRATSPCAPNSPIPSASSCPACSPI